MKLIVKFRKNFSFKFIFIKIIINNKNNIYINKYDILKSQKLQGKPKNGSKIKVKTTNPQSNHSNHKQTSQSSKNKYK